ncbi:response regulator [Paenibacillus albicereus]|uniref:Response regulator n=1 Tax=Paenibacillus albicereus TaxID=2726185 RepID=A0A6H2H0E1_9BACL|nr:response regulator [Paenibacillus albicereus]QJC53153.1 response regulator [Paenibacillus albicereus]
MPSILIVDDESIFRKGLRKMIGGLDGDWTIAGEACDGHEALDRLEALAPDVLLTDIRMPRMDGIQLQRLAASRQPGLLTVVVSGYDDFSYAQQSMRQGARDYLMKPVEREELARVLDRIGEELRTRRGAERRAEAGWQARPEMRRHLAGHVAEALLAGRIGPGELELLEQMGASFRHPYFVCLVINLDKHSVGEERYRSGDPSLFQLYIQQFAQEMLDRHAEGISFVLSETKVVALVNRPTPEPLRAGADSLAEMIRRQISSLSRLTVTIGVSAPAEGLAGIPRAYGEAEIALLHRLIAGGDCVLDYAEVGGRRSAAGEAARRSADRLEQAVLQGAPASIRAEAVRWVGELCEAARSPEAIHQQLCKLLLRCYELAEELGAASAWLGGQDIGKQLAEVCAISSREELSERLQELLARLAAAIAQARAQRERDPVASASRYIAEHYREPLTLRDVAEAVYLNPAYFSNLFKQRTGETFIEHLTGVRLREAERRLALTSDKIQAIAEETGFAHVRHFNRVFKSRTGASPKEYRERMKGSAEARSR